MKRSASFWVIALLVTLASAYYQRVTGPTYPISDRKSFSEMEVAYKLERSHSTDSNAPVEITTNDESVAGHLYWKRYRVQEAENAAAMVFENGILKAELPRQPAAGKLEYRIVLSKNSETLKIPAAEPVVIRFKGDVPAFVLIPHVIFMFVAMLLSTRTGLEIFKATPDVSPLTFWTFVLMTIGGMILGPVVQKYAFDAFWTGIPFGTDLTDNKTLIAFLAWGAALIAVRQKRYARQAVAVAAVITLIVFLVPHSMFGSEFDYSKQIARP